jgi:hypothetical protein
MLGSHLGRNNFEGRQTERIYTLVARHRVFQTIVEDPRILTLCDALFLPNYLLTARVPAAHSPTSIVSPGHDPRKTFSWRSLPRKWPPCQ